MGKMAKLYELWDGATGNLVGAYDSEQDALAAVHDTLHRYGPSAATTLALAVEDERGEGGLIASGASLIERAEAVARSPAIGVGGEEKVSDVRERGERVSGEIVGEAMAAGTRGERDEHRGFVEGGCSSGIQDREVASDGHLSRENREHGNGSTSTDEPTAGDVIDGRRRRQY